MSDRVTVFNEPVDPILREHFGYRLTFCEILRWEWRRRRRRCRDLGYGRPWCLPLEPAYAYIRDQMRREIRASIRWRIELVEQKQRQKMRELCTNTKQSLDE